LVSECLMGGGVGQNDTSHTNTRTSKQTDTHNTHTYTYTHTHTCIRNHSLTHAESSAINDMGFSA